MKINNPEILKYIHLYLSKDINEDDYTSLKKWIEKSPKNEKLFLEQLVIYKKEQRLAFLEKIDANSAWPKIISKTERNIHRIAPFKKKKKSHVFLKYASVALLIIGISFTILYLNTIGDAKPIIPKNSITLQLENGSIKIINEDGTSKIEDTDGTLVGNQKGNQLIYANSIEKEKLVYNTLTIPYGKRFDIQLSDGTIAHLNAGSSLKYPVKFIAGNKREVFLTGEAFFSVAKDSAHPFIVTAENLNIEVLGTEFNVSAYPEDSSANVVLVEGSVGMYSKKNTIKKATVLTPGTKGSFDKNDSNITTQQVNTEIYTTWMQGGLFFRNMKFSNIVKKMERHYNKKIIINNTVLKNEIFNANFNDEPIEKVLSYFKNSFGMKYEIKNNAVYIN